MAREVAAPLELEEEVRPQRPPLRRRLLNLVRQHPLGLFGLLTIALFLFAAVFADVNLFGVKFGVAPYDPQTIHRAPQTVARLSAPIDAEQTVLPISYDGKLNLGPGGPFTIDDETMYVMMIEPDALTVVRASGVTEAVPHEAGASLVTVAQVFEGPSSGPASPF
jgi:hypothetical protein